MEQHHIRIDTRSLPVDAYVGARTRLEQQRIKVLIAARTAGMWIRTDEIGFDWLSHRNRRCLLDVPVVFPFVTAPCESSLVNGILVR